METLTTVVLIMPFGFAKDFPEFIDRLLSELLLRAIIGVKG